MSLENKLFPLNGQKTPSGFYSLGAVSGTIAAGAAGGSTIFSFRWGNTARVAAIEKVTFSASVAGTAFTAGAAFFDMVAARDFTASDTGGTASTPTTTSNRLHINMPLTALTDARVSSTGALTPGTRTADAFALGSIVGASGTATTGQIVAPGTPLFEANGYPLVLKQDEGFLIRATVPATGTWSFGVNVCWSEL